jgi:hypothetical protein
MPTKTDPLESLQVYEHKHVKILRSAIEAEIRMARHVRKAPGQTAAMRLYAEAITERLEKALRKFDGGAG